MSFEWTVFATMTAVVLAVVGLLATALFQQGGRIDRLAGSMEERFDRLTGAIEQRFDRMDQRLDRMDQRLDRIGERHSP